MPTLEQYERGHLPSTDGDRKKKSPGRYVFNIVIVLVLTIGALALSLFGLGGNLDQFNGVVASLKTADYRYLLIIAAQMIAYFAFEGLIYFMFARLYASKYSYHQGVAVAFIGTFYNGITPTSSGGQVFQAYTYKKQGVPVSNAASILVMVFIVYQITLVLYGIVSFIYVYANHPAIFQTATFQFGGEETHIPMWIFLILGFVINVIVIMMLLLMSYSRHFHRFVLKYGIGFLAKIKIIRHKEKVRASIQIQVENFRIELKRLQANILFTIIIFIISAVTITIKNGIPFFAGKAIADGLFENATYFDSIFYAAFHQMVTGMFPLPGGAGAAEIFFGQVFQDFFKTQAAAEASSLIWRTATYTLPLLAAGVVTAFYKTHHKNEADLIPNKPSFIALQKETFEPRRKSSELIYQTSQLNRKAIKERFILPATQTPLDNEMSFEHAMIINFDYEHSRLQHALKTKRASFKQASAIELANAIASGLDEDIDSKETSDE
jgi:uncharacterized protein (TIRG00374 family)